MPHRIWFLFVVVGSKSLCQASASWFSCLTSCSRSRVYAEDFRSWHKHSCLLLVRLHLNQPCNPVQLLILERWSCTLISFLIPLVLAIVASTLHFRVQRCQYLNFCSLSIYRVRYEACQESTQAAFATTYLGKINLTNMRAFIKPCPCPHIHHKPPLVRPLVDL